MDKMSLIQFICINFRIFDVKQYNYQINLSIIPNKMNQQIQNAASQQTTFTFCSQASKDNPQNMFQSAVDDTNQNYSSIKSSTINKPITLDALYKNQLKRSMQSTQINRHKKNEQNSLNYPKAQKQAAKLQDLQQHQQMQDFHSYMDLTSKLQSALNKISTSRRSAYSTSRSNNLIVRFEELEMKKKEEMKRRKEEGQKQAFKEIKAKPQINKKSDKITKQIGLQPIYVRYQKIVEAKQKRFEINRVMKQKQQIQKQEKFFQQFEKHTKKLQNVRTYEEYFSQMIRWKQKKNEINCQKQERKRIQQLQALTFHPTISDKSQKIMQGQVRPPISQRGLIKQKIKPIYTFKPNISSRSSKRFQ